MNSEELKKLRKEYKLSQTSFAGIVDCYQHQVSEWERGKIQLPDKKLKYFLEKINEYKKNLNTICHTKEEEAKQCQ